MNRWLAITRPLLGTILLVLAVVSPSFAQVHLSYSPADTTIAPGQPGRLSIMVADTIEIRTIDVTVNYDTTIVGSISGAAGKLYTDSGIYTFQGFEEDTLGTWHGYAVLMGADLFIEGPGEIYTWDFEGLAEGTTPVTTVSVYVSTTDGTWFDNVSLPGTTITVHDPLSAAPGPPVLQGRLELAPNPFNPRTEVRFDLDHDCQALLAVFDARGHRVTVLQNGFSSGGPLIRSWDGRDDTGRDQPSGVYLFLLQTDQGTARTKGVLMK